MSSLYTKEVFKDHNSEIIDFVMSDEMKATVKFANVENVTLPLFPTKNGYEYFIFRPAAIN